MTAEINLSSWQVLPHHNKYRSNHPMKCPKPFALACTALLALTTLTNPIFAKEEKSSAAGSIQPAKGVKPADLPDLAKISFETALKAALAAVPGKVIKAELEVEDGSLLYSFEIVGADKSITEVEIDAENGKVLGTDVETPAPKTVAK